MTDSPTFDIRTTEALDALASSHAGSADSTRPMKEISEGLRSLVVHLGPQDWMVWRWGGFRVPTGGKTSMMLGAGEAAELGLNLSRLSHYPGFHHLLGGFRNPSQFRDAEFEARMAAWCLDRPAVKHLRFGAEYWVLGHKKRPDFEVRTPIGWIVCECKRLHVEESDLSIRLSKISAAFDRALKIVDIGSGVRLQAEVVRPIRGDLDKAAIDACRTAATCEMSQTIEHGSFMLARSVVGSRPIPHQAKHLRQLHFTVGVTPTKITEEFSHLIVSSPWMEQVLARAIGNLMNTARRQLPANRAGAILIEAPADLGEPAAATRLVVSDYAHCLTIGLIWRGEIRFSRRKVDAPVVDWIFLDRSPSFWRRMYEIVVRRSRADRFLRHFGTQI